MLLSACKNSVGCIILSLPDIHASKYSFMQLTFSLLKINQVFLREGKFDMDRATLKVPKF